MEFDFWWLPGAALFFALGWLASRKESSKQTSESKSALPEAYLRGLQSLLGDDQVRAIDAFTDLVRKEPDSLELHLALGHLFRRKGETDRAIRVHQNLLARQDLSPEKRAELLRELALDYIKAGLFDRAEQSLQSLSDSPLAYEAQKLRLDLAQRVRDWPLALSIAKAMLAKATPTQQDVPGPQLLAHLLAEIAQLALQQGNHSDASKALQEAKAQDPDHPRAWIDECLIHIGLCDQEKADDMAMVVLERWPEHAARLADRWLCMKDTSQDSSEGAVLSKIDRFAALEKAYVIEPSYDLLAPLLAYLQAQQGEQACLRFLTQHQAHHKGSLSLLAHLKRRESIPLDDGAMLKAVRLMLEPLASRSARYVCRHCGFQANRHYWQCPGCNQWDRYAPQRADERALN
jgi:lipopolysaccharide biosynthesis regulator YciM